MHPTGSSPTVLELKQVGGYMIQVTYRHAITQLASAINCIAASSKATRGEVLRSGRYDRLEVARRSQLENVDAEGCNRLARQSFRVR
jgi:hypothetical protein